MVSFIPGGWKHKVKELEAPMSREDLRLLVTGCPRMTEGMGGTEALNVPGSPFIVQEVGPLWLSPCEDAIRGTC